MNLNLKTSLKATAGCILLTFGWFFCIRPLPVRIDCLREFELIAIWILLLIGWIVFFLKLLRKNKNGK